VAGALRPVPPVLFARYRRRSCRRCFSPVPPAILSLVLFAGTAGDLVAGAFPRYRRRSCRRCFSPVPPAILSPVLFAGTAGDLVAGAFRASVASAQPPVRTNF